MELLIRSGTLDRETAKKYRSSNGDKCGYRPKLVVKSIVGSATVALSKTKMSDPITITTNGAAPAEKKSFSYVQYIHYSYRVAGVHNGLLKLGIKIRIIT